MKKIFFEFLHNVIAHPLLFVGTVLRLPLALVVAIILAIGQIFTAKYLDPPSWCDYIDPLKYAELFHDWTADQM